jgi:hypothetical protein
LLKRKEIVNSIILDQETDTGLTTSSIRSRELNFSVGRARRIPLPERKEGPEVVDFDMETNTEFTTRLTRSYRYGLTMSDNDVPGIDLSRFLVQ